MTSRRLVSVTELDGVNGFRLDGPASEILGGVQFGTSVASAGDINGDGFDDIIVGAPRAEPDRTGSAFIVFGGTGLQPTQRDVTDLDGEDGFEIAGWDPYGQAGYSVSGAGDMNGDGIDDLLIGAFYVNPQYGTYDTGQAYVVFGTTDARPSRLTLSELDGGNGFTVTGISDYGWLGRAVSSAGDVNGDGVGDILIGANRAAYDEYLAGEAFVVFGNDNGFPTDFDLATLDGTNGFRVTGDWAGGTLGSDVSGGLDFNGDGYDDVLLGTGYRNRTYVIFGSDEGIPAQFSVADLDGTNGFALLGIEGETRISTAGDINGDGYEDFVIGNVSAQVNGFFSGEARILYGGPGPYGATLDGSVLDGTNGFTITGPLEETWFGSDVSSAGDFNGDGIDDLAVSAEWWNSGGNRAGAVFIIYGQSGGFGASFDLTSIDGSNGLIIEGTRRSYTGSSVACAGDIDGDGLSDIVIGAPSGDGSAFVVYGYGDDDYILGGSAVEARSGLNGVSTVTPDAPDAADVIDAGRGSDLLAGGGGDDHLSGGIGDDLIYGEAGDDTLRGGLGRDFLWGGAGQDTLDGGGGRDTLDGGLAADVMAGGGDDDIYRVDDAADTVTEEADAGRDTVLSIVSFRLSDHVEDLDLLGDADLDGTGNDLDNTLRGGAGANHLSGRGGPDRIFGRRGDDTLDGGAGADLLNGGAGQDAMSAGAGNDTYIVDDTGDTVTERARQGRDRVESTVSFRLSAHVEDLLLLGTDDLNGAGNNRDNLLIGNDGANRLTGGAGNDMLLGGLGADTMIGGTGDDLYQVDRVLDRAVEEAGAGNDRVEATCSYRLGAHIEELALLGEGDLNGIGNGVNNTITGTQGANTLSGLGGADLLVGGAGNDRLDGGAGADEMRGGDGDDVYLVDHVGDQVLEGADRGMDTVQSVVSFTLGYWVEALELIGVDDISGTGNDRANMISGNSGANTLFALGGADKVFGLAGDDEIDGGAGNDRLLGGAGADVINGGADDDEILGGVGDDIGSGGKGADTLVGAGGNDRLNGNGGDDYLDGGEGRDLLRAGAGNDRLIGGGAADTLDGGSGLDILEGFAGNDTLRGGTGIDILSGGTGRDRLDGGAGNDLLAGEDDDDRLEGGAGNDILIGGSGRDSFVFTAGDAEVDVIGDFQVALDRIEIALNGISPTDVTATIEDDSTLIDYGESRIVLLGVVLTLEEIGIAFT